MDRSPSIYERELIAALRTIYVLQAHVNGPHLPQAAALIAARVRDLLPSVAEHPPESVSAAQQLAGEGLVKLGQLLKPAEVAELLAYFRERPCFNGHVASLGDGMGRLVDGGADQFHYGAYQFKDIVGAPHLLELANHPLLLGTAERYLGCAPTIYSMNAWWSFSGHGKAPIAQAFHRDRDDFKFCTLFVFLTDVGLENGAHEFIRRTHDPALTATVLEEKAARLSNTYGRSFRLEDLYTRDGWAPDWPLDDVFSGLIETITGPAGFGFFADTSGLHRGIPLTRGRRLMVWIRYGLYRNVTNFNDQLAPIDRRLVADRLSADDRTSYINRCLFA